MKRLYFVVIASGIALGFGVLTSVPASATPSSIVTATNTTASVQASAPKCYTRHVRIWGGEARVVICRVRSYTRVRGWVKDTTQDRRCAVVAIRWTSGARNWIQSCRRDEYKFFDLRARGSDAYLQLFVR